MNRTVLSNWIVWAILCCLLAGASTFLVWDIVPLPLVGVKAPIRGIDTPYGKLLLLCSILLACYLLMPVRSAEMLRRKSWLSGMSGLALSFFVFCYLFSPGRQTVQQVSTPRSAPTQETVYVLPGEGLYMSGAVGAILFLISTYQMRRSINTGVSG